MANFDIEKFESVRKYAIEASAGTGKTYNVMQIITKLLSENKELRLKDILIVTYTEKATAELKNRTREKLVELLKETTDPELIEKLNQEILEVDNAPIYTIHSFCQRSIAEFSLSIRKPATLDMISDNELDIFIDRFIRTGARYDLLLEIIQNGEIDGDFYETVFKNFKAFISNYYLNSDLSEDPNIISFKKDPELEKLYKYKIAKYPSDVFNIFPELKAHLDLLNQNENVLIQEFLNSVNENLLNGLTFTGSKALTNSFKTQEDQEAYNYIKGLRDTIKTFKAKHYFSYKFAKDLFIAWNEEKQRQKAQTFNDMIDSLREAIVNGAPIKDKLQEKYKYAIIDEFQDTNQKQFDIFKNLFLTDARQLTVVGDPKQSIYSFQGADVEVYKEAIKAIQEKPINGELYSLTKNYRSSASMVDSCNKLFSYYGFDSFEPVDYLKRTKQGDKEYKAMYDGKPLTNAFYSTDKQTSENSYMRTVVDFILDCCKVDADGKTKLQITRNPEEEVYSNVNYSDFVVLCRKRKEIEPIISIFNQVGIPYVSHKDTSLLKGLEAQHWLVLLKAIAANNFIGQNRKLFRLALTTNFFGHTFSDAADEKFNRNDNEEMNKILEWQALAKDKKWEELFNDILTSSSLLKTLSNVKNMSSLAKYTQIGDICIDYLFEGKTIDELVRYLSNIIKGQPLDDENGTIVKKASDSKAVVLMTMHASKGLQFPVCISVAGFKVKKSETSFKIKKDEKTNLNMLEIAGDDEDKKLAELKRLFYVAYTRPQFILFMPRYQEVEKKKTKNKTNKEDEKPNIASFFETYIKEHGENINLIPPSTKSYNALANENALILANSKIDTSTPDEQNKILAQIKKDKKKLSGYKHSYSTLSHGHDDSSFEDETFVLDKEGSESVGLSKFDKKALPVEGKYDTEVDPMNLPNDYPKGSLLGNALHEVFEDSDFTNYDANLDELITYKFIKQGLEAKETFITATKEMVGRVLNADLPEINGNKKTGNYFKLSSLEDKNKLAESEFLFNFVNEKLVNYLNGFVDLIFKRGEYYSILDWKSDKLNDEDFESFTSLVDIKKHVDNSYSIQRVLYSYCLINWLKNFYKELTLEEIFEKHFGGIYYVFLRGCNEDTSNGVYSQTWSSYQDIEDAFNEIIKDRLGGKH